MFNIFCIWYKLKMLFMKGKTIPTICYEIKHNVCVYFMFQRILAICNRYVHSRSLLWLIMDDISVVLPLLLLLFTSSLLWLGTLTSMLPHSHPDSSSSIWHLWGLFNMVGIICIFRNTCKISLLIANYIIYCLIFCMACIKYQNQHCL